jgi:hypothetical protein
MDIDAQSLVVWSNDKKHSTILVPKCISSISYEEVKSMIPGFAGFCLSFVALEKEECEHVSFAGVILLVHL